jgi:Bacterial transcriptional regulator
MRQYTPFTIASTNQLKIVLDQARRYGYALEQQEVEKGLSGVAAPVLFRDDRVHWRSRYCRTNASLRWSRRRLKRAWEESPNPHGEPLSR